MSAVLSPTPVFKGWDNNGRPLVKGQLFTYEAGTSTKQATYTDSTQGTPNTNPVILDFRGEAPVWLDPTLAYKYVLAPADDTDPPTRPIITTDDIVGPYYITGNLVPHPTNTWDLGGPFFTWKNIYLGISGQPLLDPMTGNILFYARTAAEISAGVTPANYSYSVAPYDVRREGSLNNDTADDTAALNATISVAAVAVNGATGAVVSIPTGISLLSSEVMLPNRVRIVGQNKLGSYFQAKPAWDSGTSPWVFHAANGTSSMFDSTLEDLTVDCNNVAGLGGILSDAWQENSGLRRALVMQFGTVGVKFQNGFGGASFCKLEDVEIFSGTIANTTGIDVEQMSSSGAAFLLDLQDVSIAGGAQILKGINMVAESLHCRVVHLETCTHGIYLNGNGNHTLIGVSGATTVTNLVTLDPMFNGTLTMLGCFRNGAGTILNDLRVKQIAQLGAITAGSGYTNGTYNAVPLTGGTGTGATAQIVVAGGVVTQVSLGVPGTNYAVGDTLSAAAANIGGTGSGFSIPVFQVFTGVGALGGKDYGEIQILPAAQSFGLSVTKSPTALMAWGTFDGTLTGTNAPNASQNVLSVQRTGAGRYLVTLANAAASAGNIIPIACCANPSLICAAAPAGGASFTISINNTSLAGADSNQVFFQVAGL